MHTRKEIKKIMRAPLICTIIACLLLLPTQLLAEEGLNVHQSSPDFTEIPRKFALTEKSQNPVRSGPDFISETIENLKIGIYLRILQEEPGFYRVWLPSSNKEGYISQNDVFGFDQRQMDTITVHDVIPGETLWEISERYKTSFKALIEINHLNPNNGLIVGQSLIIPKGNPDSTAVNGDKIPLGFVPINKTVKEYNPMDLNENHWAYTQLIDFLNADILKGFEEHGVFTLKSEKQITRAEFVTMVIRAQGMEHLELPNAKSFDDVKPGNWFYDYIQIASAKNLIYGIDDKHFVPNQFIRRDEIAAIIVRAFNETIDSNGSVKSFQDVPNYWGKLFIDRASASGIITGYRDNNFSPSRYATRAEAVTMLYRALQIEDNNMPTEHLLIEHVTKELSEINWHIRNSDHPNLINSLIQRTYNNLYSYIRDDITGYHQEYLNQQLKNYEALHKKHIVPQINYEGPKILQVIHRSNRFSTIEIKGANYEIRCYGKTLRIDSDGFLLLKKTPDGTWKSYMFIPSEVDSSHLIEEIINKVEGKF